MRIEVGKISPIWDAAALRVLTRVRRCGSVHRVVDLAGYPGARRFLSRSFAGRYTIHPPQRAGNVKLHDLSTQGGLTTLST